MSSGEHDRYLRSEALGCQARQRASRGSGTDSSPPGSFTGRGDAPRGPGQGGEHLGIRLRHARYQRSDPQLAGKLADLLLGQMEDT